MDTPTKNEQNSIRRFDSIAADFDNSVEGNFTAKFEKVILEMSSVSDGYAVLDVGCGSGRLIEDISRKADVKAHGIDISPKMIEVCKQRNEGISFQVVKGRKQSG